MNPVMFSLGKIEFRWYSFFILIAVIVGFCLAFREGKKRKIDADIIFDMGFYTVIFGILGARIYYVLFNLKIYQYDFLEIFRLWNGGLAIHGGILFGLLTIFVYAKIKRIKMFELTDIVAPSLIIGQAIGRWGNFFNQEAYGIKVSKELLQKMLIPKFVIKGMFINGQYYLPMFYIESIVCILGFIIILIIRKKSNKIGLISGFYFIWYGLFRFIIEYFRTDSLMLGNIKIAMLVSVLSIIIGIILIVTKNKKYKE